MNAETQQALFNYFHKEHDVMLLDGDFNEIDNMLNNEPLRAELEQAKKRVEDLEGELNKYRALDERLLEEFNNNNNGE